MLNQSLQSLNLDLVSNPDPGLIWIAQIPKLFFWGTQCRDISVSCIICIIYIIYIFWGFAAAKAADRFFTKLEKLRRDLESLSAS